MGKVAVALLSMISMIFFALVAWSYLQVDCSICSPSAFTVPAPLLIALLGLSIVSILFVRSRLILILWVGVFSVHIGLLAFGTPGSTFCVRCFATVALEFLYICTWVVSQRPSFRIFRSSSLAAVGSSVLVFLAVFGLLVFLGSSIPSFYQQSSPRNVSSEDLLQENAADFESDFASWRSILKRDELDMVVVVYGNNGCEYCRQSKSLFPQYAREVLGEESMVLFEFRTQRPWMRALPFTLMVSKARVSAVEGLPTRGEFEEACRLVLPLESSK